MAKKTTKLAKASKSAKEGPSRSKGKAAVKRPGKAAGAKSVDKKTFDDIRELVELMQANEITEVHFEDGSRKIHLRRGPSSDAAVPPFPAVTAPTLAPVPAAAPGSAEDAARTPAEPASSLIEITSPMVGTFYSAPSPDSDTYVEEGARVTDNTVVCIVEAMKVMNEIKAECTGAIVEICVSNAQPVEFGQVLFRVKPV
ncbi:MAG: acetyl-CoA carboxylase biotin carboxyl carrier protein [Planctomycetota bacterium]|jgi:acetyl-CoA carboxylase biotin carboxyl carrier protein